jgi:hypothetical protein
MGAGTTGGGPERAEANRAIKAVLLGVILGVMLSVLARRRH